MGKGDELKNEVGYMAPSANEDDIDQKGFEDSMAKYNERKANKEGGEEEVAKERAEEAKETEMTEEEMTETVGETIIEDVQEPIQEDMMMIEDKVATTTEETMTEETTE